MSRYSDPAETSTKTRKIAAAHPATRIIVLIYKLAKIIQSRNMMLCMVSLISRSYLNKTQCCPSFDNGFNRDYHQCVLFDHYQVGGPPKAGAFLARPSGFTSFRKFYERGDFPIALEHDTKGNKIAWKVRSHI